MSIAADRVRLALEITSALDPSRLVDVFSGLTPLVPRARAVQIEIAVFNHGQLDKLDQFTSITLEIKDVNAAGFINPSGTVRLSKTVPGASLNGALTADQWSSDSGATPYHAVFQFTEAEMTNIPVIASLDNRQAYGLVVVGLTGSGRVSLGTGIIFAVDDGATGSGSAAPPSVTYTLSDQELLASLATKLNAGDNPAGAYLILRDAATGRGVLLRAVTDPGASAPRLDISQV